jgi:hypothetical protein
MRGSARVPEVGMPVCGIRRLGLGALLAVCVAWSGTACHQGSEPVLPAEADVAAYYAYEGGVQVTLNGNVAEITVAQPASQLRRGGALWAKVGPYVLLFSAETRRLMEDHPAIAGVRVITTVAGGPEVARAMLTRTELTDLQWRRALNIAGRARKEGTERPALLDDLVRWGEDHTEYRYNRRYTSPR